MTQGRSNSALIGCAIATLVLLGADLGSKSWAEANLSIARDGESPAVCEVSAEGYYRYQRVRTTPVQLVDGILELEYAENCGAAFSLGRSLPNSLRSLVFGLAAIAATIWLALRYARGAGSLWFAVSVPMIVSGALGNLIDRVRYGYVVDFIHFHYDWFDYPTFNVADITIVIGVICFAIDSFVSAEHTQTGKNLSPSARDSNEKGSSREAEKA